jgi:hypothetical protein
LNNDLLLNDFIKFEDDKFFFATLGDTKEVLYIISINIDNNKKVKIRYYSIKASNLYHYNFLYDLRINKYNSYFVLASSFCNEQYCDLDLHYYSSSLIIFSYPASLDKVLKLEEYIIYNNNINFEVDLNNEIKIENNIFGLVFAKTIINDITIIGNDYKIYSSKDETIEIIPEYSLESDENITIKYEGILNYYDIFEAQIEFYYNISEPELEKYDEYPYATYIWLFLTRGAGYSDIVAAGILGNIMAEVGGGTLNIRYWLYGNGDPNYYGMCQWHNNWYPEVAGTDLIFQCDFLLSTIVEPMDTCIDGYSYP